MTNEKVYAMAFADVFPLLLAKAQRKSRTKEEVYQVTAWLTGYTPEQLDQLLSSPISYGDFFRNAPQMNPKRTAITGTVCGVKLEQIQEPLMRDIRCLDKLIDELAKGKAMDKILRK